MNLLLQVPYQRQTDNASGQGWRECFSSSVAMLLMRLGAVRNDDDYCRIRERFGDTTLGSSHLSAIKALGLVPLFTQRAGWGLLESELRADRPVAVGWLHRGPVAAPAGGGHWGVLVGLSDRSLVLNDPYGEPDLIRGGFVPGRAGVEVSCSRANWGPRWMVQGPGTGWALTVRR